MIYFPQERKQSSKKYQLSLYSGRLTLLRKGEVGCESNERWASLSPSGCYDRISLHHERAGLREGVISKKLRQWNILMQPIWNACRRAFFSNVPARGEAAWRTQEEPVLLTSKYCFWWKLHDVWDFIITATPQLCLRSSSSTPFMLEAEERNIKAPECGLYGKAYILIYTVF